MSLKLLIQRIPRPRDKTKSEHIYMLVLRSKCSENHQLRIEDQIVIVSTERRQSSYEECPNLCCLNSIIQGIGVEVLLHEFRSKSPTILENITEIEG
jgi:hypothetical protein